MIKKLIFAIRDVCKKVVGGYGNNVFNLSVWIISVKVEVKMFKFILPCIAN